MYCNAYYIITNKSAAFVTHTFVSYGKDLDFGEGRLKLITQGMFQDYQTRYFHKIECSITSLELLFQLLECFYCSRAENFCFFALGTTDCVKLRNNERELEMKIRIFLLTNKATFKMQILWHSLGLRP